MYVFSCSTPSFFSPANSSPANSAIHFFSWKKLTTFFSHRPLKSDDLFQLSSPHHSHLIQCSFYKFSHKQFIILFRCHPLDGVTRGVPSPPLPSDATVGSIIATLQRYSIWFTIDMHWLSVAMPLPVRSQIGPQFSYQHGTFSWSLSPSWHRRLASRNNWWNTRQIRDELFVWMERVSRP